MVLLLRNSRFFLNGLFLSTLVLLRNHEYDIWRCPYIRQNWTLCTNSS